MEKPRSKWTLNCLALGFRPFFLLAIPSALVFISWWAIAYGTGIPTSNYYGAVGWHSHEMLFGFSMAVIAGFLLTAVRNWTGEATLSSWPLGALALLWLAARILAVLLTNPYLIVSLDLSFPLLLALVIARPILKIKMARNYAFPLMLLLMATANLLVHLQLLGYTSDTAQKGNWLMIYMVLMMITVIFGRVFPFFSGRVLPNSPIIPNNLLEILVIASMLLAALAQIFFPALIGYSCLFVCLTSMVRLLHFYPKGVWSVPLLWILWTGYAWLSVGFGLKFLASLGLINPFLALHALTAGCIGVLTLGMMARVSLGHTGRALKTGFSLNAAFVSINLAVLVRVLFPILLPARYLDWVHVSAAIWGVAFLAMSLVFVPILVRPRPDGLPG